MDRRTGISKERAIAYMLSRAKKSVVKTQLTSVNSSDGLLDAMKLEVSNSGYLVLLESSFDEF